MKMASFSIVMKNGIRYSADAIHTCLRDGDLKPQVAFICSGRMVVKDASEIASVEFHYNTEYESHCNFCEQSTPALTAQPV